MLLSLETPRLLPQTPSSSPIGLVSLLNFRCFVEVSEHAYGSEVSYYTAEATLYPHWTYPFSHVRKNGSDGKAYKSLQEVQLMPLLRLWVSARVTCSDFCS
jgi:hypothetical protein